MLATSCRVMTPALVLAPVCDGSVPCRIQTRYSVRYSPLLSYGYSPPTVRHSALFCYDITCGTRAMPPARVVAPACNGSEPCRIHTRPETLSARPETLSARPETLSARPETLSARPETLSALPRLHQVACFAPGAARVWGSAFRVQGLGVSGGVLDAGAACAADICFVSADICFFLRSISANVLVHVAHMSHASRRERARQAQAHPEHEPLAQILHVLAAAVLEHQSVDPQLHAIAPLETLRPCHLGAMLKRQVAVAGL